MSTEVEIILTIIGFGITVGTLIWRMAILHHQCTTNKESINRAHDRIGKVEDTQNNKILELSKQLQELRETQIRMLTKLEVFLSSLEGMNAVEKLR